MCNDNNNNNTRVSYSIYSNQNTKGRMDEVMEEYQLRVVDERNDLFKKIVQLRYWLSVPRYYGQRLDKQLLEEQLSAMELYLTLLDRRIERMT